MAGESGRSLLTGGHSSEVVVSKGLTVHDETGGSSKFGDIHTYIYFI
jgi:hypothetical protein